MANYNPIRNIPAVSLVINKEVVTLPSGRTISGKQALVTGGVIGGVPDVAPSRSVTSKLSTNVLTVDEGALIAVSLLTDKPAGTLIPYTITGVTSADISGSPLTGNFIANQSTIQAYIVKEDALTEGSETFKMSLDGTDEFVEVSITDTSLSPSFSIASNANTVNEGQTFTITLTTTNPPAGRLVPYTITGISSADIDKDLTGNFIVGTTDAITFTVTEDGLTEGAETIRFTIDETGDYVDVAIVDTSITPVYNLSVSSNSAGEGTSFTATLATTNVATNTYIGYEI